VNLAAEEESLDDPGHVLGELRQASIREGAAAAGSNVLSKHDDEALTLARGRLLSSLDEFSGAHQPASVPENTVATEASRDHARAADTSTVPPYASSMGGHQEDRSWLSQTNGGAGPSGQFAQGITEPIIFTISDRRVRIDPGKEESSLYTLCRRWLANDPEARDEEPQQLPMHPSLPPPEPKAPDSPPPPMPSSSSDGAEGTKAASLEEHKVRFLGVRKYWEGVRRKKVARFKTRMSMILPRDPQGAPEKK